jgi:hypothetical protein
MAQSRNTGSEFVGGDQSAETMRRKFIETPMNAAQQPAVDALLEVASLLAILPQAFIGSQKRELERMTASGKEKENEPRIADLKASIERAEVIAATAQRGQVRAQKAFTALNDNAVVFHGFVSDETSAPMLGLTVRLLNAAQTRKGKPLEATTDKDGYFRIKIGTKGDQTNPFSGLFTGSAETKSQRSSDQASAEAQVQILGKQLLYTDPWPVPMDQGSVYREYAISQGGSQAGTNLDSSAPKAARGGRSRTKPKK